MLRHRMRLGLSQFLLLRGLLNPWTLFLLLCLLGNPLWNGVGSAENLGNIALQLQGLSLTHPVGLEPTASGFGNLRSTN